MENSENKPKKIGLMTLLGYGMGFLLMLSAAGAFATKELGPAVGITYLLAALSVFPPFWKFMKQKYNFELSRPLKICAFIIFAGISGGLMSNKVEVEKQVSTNSSPTESPASSISKSVATPESNPTYKIGDTVNMGGKTLTVNSVKPYTSRNQYMGPKQGNKFVAVDVSLKNDSSDAFNYNVLEFRLQDNQDYQYTNAVSDLDPYLTVGVLQPSQTTRGFIVYEIPQDNNSVRLTSTPGFWDRAQIIIELK